MKKLLGILAISALAASAFAQGTVVLGNQTGLIKQWTASDNSALISVPKSGGYVQLIAAAKGTALPNPLFTSVAGGVTKNYTSLAGFLAANPGWAAALNDNGAQAGLIAAGAGIINAGTYTINNIAAGADTDYIYVAWTGAFTTLDAALTAGSSFFGESAIATSATGNPQATPAGTATFLRATFPGMTLAPIAVVPEPSSFALAGLGAAALMIFRRRK